MWSCFPRVLPAGGRADGGWDRLAVWNLPRQQGVVPSELRREVRGAVHLQDAALVPGENVWPAAARHQQVRAARLFKTASDWLPGAEFPAPSHRAPAAPGVDGGAPVVQSDSVQVGKGFLNVSNCTLHFAFILWWNATREMTVWLIPWFRHGCWRTPTDNNISNQKW